MLKIPVSRVPEEGSLIEEDWLLEIDALGLKAPFVKEKRALLNLECSRVGPKILARGRVSAWISFECSRCLEAAEKPVEAGFFIEFEPPSDDNAGPSADEDPNVAFLDDKEIPIGEELRQELELARPLKILCRDNCKGLCSVCGNNRNKKECDCDQGGGHHPLEKLKDLLKQDD